MIAPFITLFINLAWGISLEKAVGARVQYGLGGGLGPALAELRWGSRRPNCSHV